MKVNTEALSDSKDKAEAFHNFFLSHSNFDVSQLNCLKREVLNINWCQVKHLSKRF